MLRTLRTSATDIYSVSPTQLRDLHHGGFFLVVVGHVGAETAFGAFVVVLVAFDALVVVVLGAEVVVVTTMLLL